MNKELNIAGKIAKAFINHPLTFILGISILILGYFSLLIMPKEENPQIKVSGGVVIVALPDAKASEVQKVIIEPLERKIKEIKGVEHIYSFAQDSVGIVQVQFYIGEDKEHSNLKLYDQVMRNMDLMPKNAMQPIIKTMDIDTAIPIATIAFYSAKENGVDILSQSELFNIVNPLTQKINQIKNVASVELKGDKKEQFNVLVDINRLSAYNLSLAFVSKQIEALNFNTPNISNYTKDGKYTLFSIEKGIENIKDLENLIISYNFGTPIYLKDIATITKSYDIQNKKDAFIYLKNKDKYFQNKNTYNDIQIEFTAYNQNWFTDYLNYYMFTSRYKHGGKIIVKYSDNIKDYKFSFKGKKVSLHKSKDKNDDINNCNNICDSDLDLNCKESNSDNYENSNEIIIDEET